MLLFGRKSIGFCVLSICVTDRQTHTHLDRPKDTTSHRDARTLLNKAGYTATLVVCGWAGAVLEKVTRALWQEQQAKKLKNAKK